MGLGPVWHELDGLPSIIQGGISAAGTQVGCSTIAEKHSVVLIASNCLAVQLHSTCSNKLLFWVLQHQHQFASAQRKWVSSLVVCTTQAAILGASIVHCSSAHTPSLAGRLETRS